MKFTKDSFLQAMHGNAKQYIETFYSEKSPVLVAAIKKNFGPIDFLHFDWISGPQDRTWWWKIHQLQPLMWYVKNNEYRNNESLFSFTLSILLSWIKLASHEDKSPLAWHDHATAFRFINIIYWLVDAATHKKLNKIDDESLNIIFDSIYEHFVYLIDETNYSRHTNHGYDQSLNLYIGSLLLKKNKEINAISKIAKLRLWDEINFAFTKQAVHKETSPGYHSYMIRRVRYLDKLNTLGVVDISKKTKKLLYNAQKFLNAITLPDGTLPLIGDTPKTELPGHPSIPNNSPSYKIFDYTSSGWFVVVGRTTDGKIFHLIAKAGHLSNYHRHDDDLSVHLYFDGIVVLGDAGLYLYQEKDPCRLFCRSNLAHSTVFPEAIKAIRDKALLPSPPSMSLNSDGTELTLRTSAYGGILERSIDLTKLPEGRLVLKDRWIKGCSEALTVNFYLPYGSDTIHTPSEVIVRAQTVFAKFQVALSGKNIPPRIFKHTQSNPVILSPEIGQKFGAMRLAFASAYKQGDCMDTYISFGSAKTYFPIPDDKDFANFSQEELAKELWKLTPAVKDTPNDLQRVISILSPLKIELLNTELLYLLFRTYIWIKDINKASIIYNILSKRKDLTPSQHINSLKELVANARSNKKDYYYFTDLLLYVIHTYNYNRFSEFYFKIAQKLCNEFEIPSPSECELKTSFIYPILLKYIYSFRPTSNKNINTFLSYASKTQEHKKLFTSMLEYTINTNYIEKNYTHYIITKFCIGIMSPELIEYRLALFEAITLPSITKQENQKFIWLICVGDIMPVEQLRKLQKIIEPYPNIILLPSGFIHAGAARSAKGFILQHTKTPFILISRLDDDDGWELTLNEHLHKHIELCLDKSQDNRAITFSAQLRWDAETCSGEFTNFPWLANTIHVLSKFDPDKFFSPYDYRHTQFADYAASHHMKIDILDTQSCRGLWTRHFFTDCTASVEANQIDTVTLQEILEKNFGVNLTLLDNWKKNDLPKIKNYNFGKYRTILQQTIDSSFKCAKNPSDRVVSLQALLDLDNYL